MATNHPDPPGYETRKAECRGAHCWHLMAETTATRTEQCCFCGSMLQRSFYEVPDPKHGPYSRVMVRVYADTRRD